MSLKLALDRLDRVRRYTLALVADIEDPLWFTMPPGCPTHVAWQVGHLAMAEYAAGLMRVRGAQPGDRDIISREFRKQFSKGTIPSADPHSGPSPVEILDVLSAVHAQLMLEAPQFDEADLEQPLAAPHEMFTTKLGALLFVADHEMLHAGQIGLLRRMLGKPPLR
ncbi:MAG: DinB family protein [Planctomycetales bacterium]|nr:DinB family protein [Planctomycetales bacterium]